MMTDLSERVAEEANRVGNSREYLDTVRQDIRLCLSQSAGVALCSPEADELYTEAARRLGACSELVALIDNAKDLVDLSELPGAAILADARQACCLEEPESVRLDREIAEAQAHLSELRRRRQEIAS